MRDLAYSIFRIHMGISPRLVSSSPHVFTGDKCMKDSFSTSRDLIVGDRTHRIAHLPSLEARGFNISRLPFSMRILLENLLRREDGDGCLSAMKGEEG